MDLVKMRPAAEFSAATDRINIALAKLKTDLVQMRSQDVTLMKQLLNINETIQNISERHLSCKKAKRNTAKMGIQHSRFTPTLESQRILVQNIQHSRLPSVPEIHSRHSGSLSSIEDECVSEEEFSSSCSESDTEDRLSESFSSIDLGSFINTNHSESSEQNLKVEHSCQESDNDEFILKKNIKMWKYSMSIRRNSLDSNSSAESDISELSS